MIRAMIRQRCAIYTRKSTEEGLDQAFNSLDAQREACAAYILSQRHEGWIELPDRYDDGGYSGGTMDRPGLHRLLANVQAGRIDVIVVYKVDRLSRALADFAKMVEVFDAANVSFVSVTQAFNTTSSMGRLTLNVLLSFAQFEREVTAERIRDKVAASKKRGIWMGGAVPIGYEARDRALVIHATDAETVRLIFSTYAEVKSVPLLKQQLDRSGIVTKSRRTLSQEQKGGQSFSSGALYHLLRNPVYIGKVRHRGALYDGQHAAIVDPALWQEVQDLLDGNGGGPITGPRTSASRWLDGLLFDREGRAMKATYAMKPIPGAGGSARKRYWYYVSRQEGGAGARARLPAKPVEDAVRSALATKLADRAWLAARLGELGAGGETIASVIDRAATTAMQLSEPGQANTLADPPPVLLRLQLQQGGMTADLDLARLLARTKQDMALPVSFDFPMLLQQNGRARPIVLRSTAREPHRDAELIALLADARRWRDEMLGGQVPSIDAITRRERLAKGMVSRILPLAWLAPDITAAILDGLQPATMTAKQLREIPDLPLPWSEQRALLGFPAV